jgi:hypothetical protein
MKANNNLQKFTKTEIKINKILSLERITPFDIEQLNEMENSLLMETLTKNFNKLKGIERDKYYHKIELITGDTTKNQLWESNHIKITNAISNFIQQYGRMPAKTEIAEKTELSRQTIHKHLKEYINHPQYLGQIEQFKFLTSKVLARVFHFAVNGDIQAAKLYFNLMGLINNGQTQNNTLIQNQNNYIQINGTVLSQENVKHLTKEQLHSIELIIKS